MVSKPESNFLAQFECSPIMDTTYVYNQVKIPAEFHTIVDNIPDTINVQGKVGLCCDISSSIDSIHFDFDKLISVGESVRDYGTGFNDTVAIIVLPLIIALFAFAFPFIFSVINHINSKYDSDILSKMFTQSREYKNFWRSNILSVITALIFGALLLISVDYFHRVVGCIGSIILLGAVSFEVYCVIRFVSKSIQYNKPHTLIDEIDRNLDVDIKKAIKFESKRQKKFKKKISREKSEKAVYVLKQFGGYSSSFAEHNAKMLYVSRLNEVCRYAFKGNDSSLFYATIYPGHKLFDDEKVTFEKNSTCVDAPKPMYLLRQFLDQAFSDYLKNSDNKEFADTLIRTSLMSFNNSRYVNPVDLCWMMKRLLNVASSGRHNLIQKYISDSKYSFHHIMRLPQVLYVQDGDVSLRPEVEKKSRENWRDVCDWHYLLLAYEFSMGDYSIVHQVLKQSEGRYDVMYPTFRSDILLRYAQCKKKVRPNGGFDFWSEDELYNRSLDENFIDRFTAILFCYAQDDDVEGYYFAQKETIELLHSYKNEFENVCKKIQKNELLKKAFPEIAQFPFAKEYKKTVDAIERKPEQKVFETSAEEGIAIITEYFNHNDKQLLYQLYGRVHVDVNTIEWSRLPLNACPFAYNKLYLLNTESIEPYFEFRNICEVLDSRAMFLMLKAFSKMELEEKELTPIDFDSEISHKVENEAAEYVLLDFDCHCSTFLKLDRKAGFNYQYGEIPFVMMSGIRYSHLRDLPLYDKVAESLLLIRKQDLPVITKIDEKKDGWKLNWQDNSSFEENRLEVRVEIDTNLELRYNPKAKVMKYKTIPMKI